MGAARSYERRGAARAVKGAREVRERPTGREEGKGEMAEEKEEWWEIVHIGQREGKNVIEKKQRK